MAMMQGPQQEAAPVQEQQGPTQESGSSFPTSQEQGDKLLLNIINLVHSDEKVPQLLDEANKREVPVAMALGSLAAQLLVQVFTQVFKQTNGMQVDPAFAIEAVRRAVGELAQLSAAEGHKVAKEDLQQAAKVAGDSLEQTMEDLYNTNKEPVQQGPPVQQQGLMQGPPQGGM